MKRWLIAGWLVMAYVVVPVYINWLRHRPNRLTESTQHLVLAGLLAQVVLVVMAVLLGWFL